MPFTMPVGAMVATEVFELDQSPPAVASASVIVDPVQTLPGPVMSSGVGFTVMYDVLEHPLKAVYVIVATPTLAAETSALSAVIGVTTTSLVLVHVPPVVVELMVIVPSSHIVVSPLISLVGLTVTTAVLKHPFDST
jgi:hypothetical protein